MGIENTILVVDDEPNVLRSLALVLRQAGYLVVTAADAAEALGCMQAGRFGLVLLDLKLPDMRGTQLFHLIRENWPEAAILILTASILPDESLVGMGDLRPEIIHKPADPPLLLERISELLQRSPHFKTEHNPWGTARLLRCGPLLLDMATRQVSLDNRYLSLSNCAFNFLLALARHAPRPMTYLDLTHEALNCQVEPAEAEKQARQAIGELRRALETDPQHPVLLRNLRGVGYYLAVMAESGTVPVSQAGFQPALDT
jgi:DNA-binding response OmpR family regulator